MSSRVIQHHPAALRNRVPICEILQKIMKSVKGRALELGSGTGAHLEYFAPRFPDLTFLPSEREFKISQKTIFNAVSTLQTLLSVLDIQNPMSERQHPSLKTIFTLYLPSERQCAQNPMFNLLLET